MFNLEHNGRLIGAETAADLAAMGVPAEVAGAEVKAKAILEVAAFANVLRERVASPAAGKLMEYSFKEDIARDPENADPDQLVLIDREAAARGLDRVGLLAIISTKAAKHREAALLIGALEAEMKAAVEALPVGAADIEALVQTVLSPAKAAASVAISNLMDQIHGTS